MIRLCAFSDEAGSSLNEQIIALKRNNLVHPARLSDIFHQQK